MRPDHGGRFSLTLTKGDADAAHFEAELSTPDGDWRASARVDAEGEVAWAGLADAGPPEWLVGYARAALRAAHRQRRQGWPRRITRWRQAPSRETGTSSRR